MGLLNSSQRRQVGAAAEFGLAIDQVEIWDIADHVHKSVSHLSWDDAQEAVSEALLELTGKWEDLDDLHQITGWLYVVARTRAVQSRWERARRRLASVEQLSASSSAALGAVSRPDDLDNRMLLAELLRDPSKIETERLRVAREQEESQARVAAPTKRLGQRTTVIPKPAEPRKWTDGRIIAALQDWQAKHGRVPISSDTLGDSLLPSYPTVRSAFGSWNAGLRAAGIQPPRAGRRTRPWSKEEAAEVLKAFRAEEGRWPKHAEFKENPVLPSDSTVRNHFGTASGRKLGRILGVTGGSGFWTSVENQNREDG